MREKDKNMISKVISAVVCLTALFTFATVSNPAYAAPTSVYDFTVPSIDGIPVPLSTYKGDVLMIVNTASLCGNTPQYKALEAIYEKYKSQGFVILGFPANNFHQQEPGTNAQILQFCTATYHTTFPIFSKISVAGDDQAPLYTWLTSKTTDPQFGGPIEWNFAKFLIDKRGHVVGRFLDTHYPDSPDVTAAIEAQLTK
jgi:glutathione peroxidase